MITGMGACGDKDEGAQFEIYENHEISACGVDDPLVNLDWLIEACIQYGTPGNYNSSDIRIELYANIDTQEEYIVVFFFPLFSNAECVDANPHSLKRVYTCSGDMFPFDSHAAWVSFFSSGENESQGIIWYKRRIN